MCNNKLNKKVIEKVKIKLAISNFEKKEMKKSMTNNKILKTVATFVIAVGIIGSVTYASVKLVEIFKIRGMDDAGIQTALQNNYVQNIDMDYIEEEKVKFKVDYLMMDDINFDLVFNFVTEDSVDNYEGIAVSNLKITDENENQIYIDSENQDIWTKNIALMTGNWSVIEKQGNTIRQVIHLTSNNFPKSNKIYVNFDNVVLYNVNQGNPITIEYEGDYKLEFDVSKQLAERKSIEYKAKNSKIIENIKLTNSGLVMTLDLENYISDKADFTVTDSQGNVYTLAKTIRILDKNNLDKIDKQVLIFNMTIYNECDNIILKLANGSIYELMRKDNIKVIKVNYKVTEVYEELYDKVYFENDKLKYIEQCKTYKTIEEAQKEYEKMPDLTGATITGKMVSIVLSLADNDDTQYDDYINMLDEEKKSGIIKDYRMIENN